VLRRLENHLLAPVDNSPLIVFRILFGVLLAAETGGAILTGWVKEVLVEPEFTFPMLPFSFLQPLPGWGMYFYFAGMAVAGLLVAVGAWFRASLSVFTVMWTAVYLMQTSSYNNHYYLLILLCVLMLATPANADWSWDVRRHPHLRRQTCPRWCLSVFVLQIAIVYTYAAIAKIEADWLQAKPMAIWLFARRDYYLGPLYELAWFKYAIAWGGLLFDATAVPLLLWRRTRMLAVGLSVFFHLFNSYTFRIGIFPYLALSLLVFFFPGEQIGARFLRRRTPVVDLPVAPTSNRIVLGLLGIYFVVQLLLPLQSLWFPGNVNWTEEGQRMSWRMMLRSKDGSIHFVVRNPKSGEEWRIYPSKRLTPKQTDRIATRPDMIWLFVQRLKREYGQRGVDPVEIYAVSSVSLNGRRRQPIVDPEYDMAKAEWHYFRSDEWIEPLRE